VPERRDLSPLFSPASVAVVGASDDQKKWGNWLARQALDGESVRKVFLINRRSETVLGRPAYPTVSSLPEAPELVVLCVPAASFETTVDDALARGARGIVAITAGMAEIGPEGEAVEAAVARKVREAGAVLLGPNCLGLSDAASNLNLASNELPPGGIGLISQSGNLGLELGIKAKQASIGFARFASVGNQADLDVADLVADYAAAAHIAAIAVYCEDFKDGRAFLEAADVAAEEGKPVILLAPGTSEAAVRAARSHTGALVSSSAAIDAACRAARMERVRTPKELIDLAQALLLGLLPASGRVAVVADGGGHGAIAADVAEAFGLVVPALSPELQKKLDEATGTAGGRSNPVDLAGAGERDIWSFHRLVSALEESHEVDALLLTGYFGGYSSYSPEVEEGERKVASAIVEAVRAGGKPLVMHSMHRGEPPVGAPDGADALERLRAGALPVYPSVEEAAGSLARLAVRAEALRTRAPGSLRAAAVLDAGAGEEPVTTGGYFPARELLERHGLRFPPARIVATTAEALKAAEEIGFPVVAKAVALEHKSDRGGVRLSLSTEAELEEAVADLWSRLGHAPLSLEAMVTLPGGVELLIGVVRDRRFGPFALAGLGGVYTEILSDVAVALAPVSEAEAEHLFRSLKGAALFLGARGRRQLAVSAAARALAQLSEVAVMHPEIAEIEINPLLLGEETALCLDARLVLGATAAGKISSAAESRQAH
jgi:acyl-CoA synthetase (NDP forming)